MANEFVRVAARGIHEAKTELRKMDVKADAAAVAGLKAIQSYGVKMVRSKLRGRPRWDIRGRSRIWSEPVNLGLYGASHNNPRAGAPGRFTGVLAKSVGQVKRPKRTALGTYKGGVGIGGMANNPRKGKLERDFPFFAPAMKQVETAALPMWEKAVRKSIER